MNNGEHRLSYLVSDSFRGFAAAEKSLKAKSECRQVARCRCTGNRILWMHGVISKRNRPLLLLRKKAHNRGRLSGIGGQMIEAERKLVVIQPPREQQTEKQTNNCTGAQDMRLAANMVLEESSVDIARALAKSSMEGHIQCVKFLYELAEYHEKLGAAETARTIRSLASEWAAEPEWLAEMSEEDAETARGSREPEG